MAEAIKMLVENDTVRYLSQKWSLTVDTKMG